MFCETGLPASAADDFPSQVSQLVTTAASCSPVSYILPTSAVVSTNSALPTENVASRLLAGDGMDWYSGDLGNVDMSDLLDDMSADFMSLTDDCDLCSPTDGVRATFEKLMEVTTSKS